MVIQLPYFIIFCRLKIYFFITSGNEKNDFFEFYNENVLFRILTI